ncbi:NEAT domain-containing protein [Lacticaseibacillus baoqingensis]|uniref:NEAT domain-containing protein n=1 Tax=Lacticaseibacillus baoqingensis TaxID=2486013 RepID=A0ABW4E4J9_9LACO|nr:NEAT domain-containing protein [Lacticaseibacillus baoqingensis]
MVKRHLFICLFPVFAFLLSLAPNVVHADTINYQALKYGTNSESLASGYYVKPATITVNGDQYLVTMTIHTGVDLGQWPVTVLSINGSGPANVTKTQSASGYDYSYAFETKDLSQTINSAIDINVPHVYVAKHDISFKFDTSHLPALPTASAAPAATAKAPAANSASKAQAPSQAASASSQSAAAAASAAKASSQKQAQKAKQAARQASRKTQQQAAQIKALNRKNQQTQQAIIFGGIVAVIILGAAAFFFVKRK